MPVLATVASSAPFVGLFGTVGGIITAFQKLADPTKGGGGIGTVSAGIAEALITTAVGLGVAIIAVWFYNYFTARLDDLTIDIDETASELVDTILRGGRGVSGARRARQRRRPRRRRHLAVKRHPKGQVRAEINVTPLVDVTLVLLIIFMVVTPMIVARRERRAASHQPPRPQERRQQGPHRLHQRQRRRLPERRQGPARAGSAPPSPRSAAATPTRAIFVKADRRIRYGTAREVMESIHRAGVEDVQLGTEEQRPAQGEAAP